MTPSKETPEASGFDRVTPDTEWIDIALANLIFAGLSIAQVDKIPKWLLENMEKNKTKFKETIITSRDTYWKERVEQVIKSLPPASLPDSYSESEDIISRARLLESIHDKKNNK